MFQGFFFHTDSDKGNIEPGAGYSIEYKFLHNCSNLEYFKFPV